MRTTRIAIALLLVYEGLAAVVIGPNVCAQEDRSWRLAATSGPSPRMSMELAYDSRRRVCVLYGGYAGGSFLGDTWEWDGTGWTNLSPELAHSPGPRCMYGMAYDEARGVVVLFGGLEDGTSRRNDLWEYDGTDWTHRADLEGLPAVPPPKDGMAFCYDSDRGVFVMHGGDRYNDDFSDREVWEYDGTQWTRRPDAPDARRYHTMAYHPGIGRVVRHGGYPTSNRTYYYDGSTWHDPGHGLNGNYWWQTMVYDEAYDEVVIFGGNTIGDIRNQKTWTNSGSGWTDISGHVTDAPSSRGEYGMAFDAARRVIVLFGGETDSGYSGETWCLGAANPRLISVEPPSASPGDTLDVDVLGANTHFDETSEVYFGLGTLVNDVVVYNTAELSANVSISWDAPPGPRDVTVTTGDEVAVGENLFTILGEGYVPPPTGLTASAGASSIFLEWEPSSGYYVTGYNVYRDIAIDGEYTTKLNESPVTDTSYEDSTVTPGGRYYYKVTAVTYDPFESEMSEPAWATAGEIIITMPDIRGEAGETVRLPINLDCAWGVNGSGMEIHLTYDTALLSPIAVEKTVLTEDFTFVDNVDVADGQIDIAGVGEGTLVGKGHILDILFEVDPDATLDETGTFTFVNVIMYDWELTELDVDYSDTATFTVSPYYVLGDVTGDGDVTIQDAILAQKFANGEEVPTPLQLLAGDINGDGVIDSADVTLILRMVLGLPINPEQGAGAAAQMPLFAQGTPHVVSIASASGYYGDTVPVAVSINNASGVAGCDLTITFDATAFEVTDVVLGALTSGFSLDWTVSGGVLKISLASSTALGSGSGDLCVIYLKVRTSAIEGDTVLNLASVKLSGEHGEDLSWKSAVTKSSGIFAVLGQGVPAVSAPALIALGAALAMAGKKRLRA